MDTSGVTEALDRPDSPGVRIPVVNKGDRLETQPITVCYWDAGKLYREDIPITKFQYIAISHIWGHANWRTIPGIEGEVLCSDEKAKFLTDSLPSIVGDDYFWMDILCVNQKDKTARVAVTQYIPRIFRHAQRTIFVKDDGGIQSCCADSLGEFSADDDDLSNRLTEHRTESHPSQPINERTLTRLWILEETIQSNAIQFVNCQPGVIKETAVESNAIITSTRFVMKLRELAKAWAGAYAPWKSTPSSAVDGDAKSFMHSFFKNTTVRRYGINARLLHQFPESHTFYRHIFSTRRTSKARDFILATMPQYGFYTVPENAKEMTFGELFKDCVYQLWRGGFPMQPIVSRQTIPFLELSAPEYQIRYVEQDVDAEFPEGRAETLEKFPLPETITDLPEPVCLGDLVKLFCGPRTVMEFYPPLDAMDEDTSKYITHPAEDLAGTNLHSIILPANQILIKVDQPESWRVISPQVSILVSIARIHPVKITEVSVHGKKELLTLLKTTRNQTRPLWAAAILGELHETIINIMKPEEGIFQHSLKDEYLAAQFLYAWWIAEQNDPPDAPQWEEFPNMDQPLSTDGQNFTDDVILLATLITCGLGVGSFEWSKRNLVPVLVGFQETQVMALVPHVVLQSEMSYDFWLAGAVMPGEDRWCLLARYIGESEPLYVPCIYPWIVDKD
jgi:hypothetical protein